MTSGTITTKVSSHTSDDMSVKRSAFPKGKALLLMALLAVGAILAIRDIPYLPQYQEWRFSRMSLAQLQQERGSRLDNPRLLYFEGLRLNQQSRFMEADPLLRNAAGLDPDTPRIRDAWAQALVRTGRVTAAFGELKEFAGRHTGMAEAHLLLGKFYLTQESLVRAGDELKQATTLDPSLADAWSYLTSAQSGMGHLSDAEASERHAVALQPHNLNNVMGLGLLLLAEGKVSAARASFAQAVAISPKSAAAHREYGRCLLRSGAPADLTNAEAELRRSLELQPADPGADALLGQALMAEGKPKDALPILSQAATALRFDPEPALVLSQAYARTGDPVKSHLWEGYYTARSRRALRKQSLITTIMKTPGKPHPQMELALMLAEEGDVDGCLRHNAEARHCAPDAPPALIATANQLTAFNYAAAALVLAQRAADTARNNPMAREAMGNAQLALGRPDDAALSFGQAATGFPDRRKKYQALLNQYDYAQQHPEAGGMARMHPGAAQH
jgi:tetratricopeptide (TPR) repeat protein